MERRAFSLVLSVLSLSGAAWGQEVLHLCDFETDEDLRSWEISAGESTLVAEGVTHGERALELTMDPNGRWDGAHMFWRRVRRDWSGFDALVLDVVNPGSEPITGNVLVADEAWQNKGSTYWNRHNGGRTFAPGKAEWVIPVRGLYRGEAGSRNNDIKRNIDPDQIVRLDFGFGRKGDKGRAIVDNLRLVRTGRPYSVHAYDFGPPAQSVMLGWTAVSQETGYDATRGYGWWPVGGGPWNGAARDTTFGTMLLQDFCEAGGYRFRVDVPAGRYRVTVFYENSGYWGGEQAMHRERTIHVNEKAVWQEMRDDGQAHALYRFEQQEPVGVDLWDAYMASELAKAVTFGAVAGDEGMTFRFEADRTWGSKVSALVVVPDGDGEAVGWVEAQLGALAREFREKAVCLDSPASVDTPPSDWRELGLSVWEVGIEEDVTPASLGGDRLKAIDETVLRQIAVRGEFEPFCLAVRPQRTLGECRLSVEPLSGPSRLDAVAQVVWYNTSRGFNSIAYRVKPHTLRTQETLTLSKGVTREVVVTVHVPADATPGEYAGALRILSADGAVLLRVPLRLDVRPVRLSRETDFLMGFFGLMPPRLSADERHWDVLEQTLVMLREHGMNAVSGGPSWSITGWRDGKPVIDFGEMDRFFVLLRKHGFDRPLNGYGGGRFGGLHTRYEKGVAAEKMEAESGRPYADALKQAWQAVDVHAQKQQWPTILYAMCDETRVRDKAERELEFMKLMGDVSALFPRTVQTSGSYSVDFKSRSTDLDSLLHWHQRFFVALDISSLNGHDESVMAEARRLGKQVHIYNQGRTRYSFGLYQWSEFRKGIRARWQWHLNVLHGYQFFDLDGREPDTAMLCYGRHGLYPTIHFERCREGAEDFYLYQTLCNAVQTGRRRGTGNPALGRVSDFLSRIESSVKLNQRQPPAGYDADALKREAIGLLEELGARR